MLAATSAPLGLSTFGELASFGMLVVTVLLISITFVKMRVGYLCFLALLQTLAADAFMMFPPGVVAAFLALEGFVFIETFARNMGPKPIGDFIRAVVPSSALTISAVMLMTAHGDPRAAITLYIDYHALIILTTGAIAAGIVALTYAVCPQLRPRGAWRVSPRRVIRDRLDA